MVGEDIELANGVRMPAVQLGTFRTRGAAVRSGVGQDSVAEPSVFGGSGLV